MKFYHQPVLVEECIEGLNIKPNGVYIDGTVGGAGHAQRIYQKLDNSGALICIDQDKTAVDTAKCRLEQMRNKSSATFSVISASFKDIKNICLNEGIHSVDGILLDLGVSSYQLDTPERGFSYNHDAFLDMRMDQNSSLTAEDIVNSYTQEQLANIMSLYGEEKWASRIAKFIVEERSVNKISTTSHLIKVIKAAIPNSARREGPHPAKRTFQALRIAVNDELNILSTCLEDGFCLMKSGARFCVISFHSLEDRIVKNSFIQKVKPCACSTDLPKCVCGKEPIARMITKKPITASESELASNPRARSAKLRILEKY